jgi:hypothetical protein
MRVYMGLTRLSLAGLLFLLLVACPGGDHQITVDGDVDVNVGTQSIGLIQGRVTVATVENNTIAWAGFSGATVSVQGTPFSTSSLGGGIYAIDRVPAGSHNVVASMPAGSHTYSSGAQAVVVLPQSVSTVPDHQLVPVCTAQLNLILHGRVYWQDGVTPFATRTVRLHSASRNSSTGEYSPGTLKATTVTNTDGSFAFHTGLTNLLLATSGYTIRFRNPDSPVTGTAMACGIVGRDAQIQ